jgi:hypothetical protein
MESSNGTLGGGELYSVLRQLYREFLREFSKKSQLKGVRVASMVLLVLYH